MSAPYQQNAVTQRIETMRAKWLYRVGSKTKLVRWLIKEDEIRMVEAFCKLEETQYAQLPQMFLTLEADFVTDATYDHDLKKEFLARFEDEKQLALARKQQIDINWNHKAFVEEKFSLLETLQSHVESFKSFSENFVIYLKPRQCHNASGLCQWIKEQLKKKPPRITICIHDFLGSQVFDNLFIEDDDCISLTANLNMESIAKEIIEANLNPTDFKSQFTHSIYMMGQETGNKNEKELGKWGAKAITCAKRLKQNSLEATAYMCWGINLFYLKNGVDAIDMYDKALAIAYKGIDKNNDIACQALIGQIYSYKASCYIHTKQYKKAMAEYESMAQSAKKYEQPSLEMEARKQAGDTAVKMTEYGIAYEQYYLSFKSGFLLDSESRKVSQFPLVSKTLYDLALQIQPSTAKEVDLKMQELLGENWYQIINQDYYANVHGKVK